LGAINSRIVLESRWVAVEAVEFDTFSGEGSMFGEMT